MTTRPTWPRRTVLAASGGALAGALAACGTPAPASPSPTTAPAPATPAVDLAAPASAVLPRVRVPVLCWHQLRDWQPDDSAYSRATLICPPAAFRAQLDAVAGAGYTTIGPDDYLAHLTTGAPLPPKPIILTFDDSQGSQITVGAPELARRHMTATFFVMTVPLDKPRWMSRDDVRALHHDGHTIAAHTYDHHRVDRYAGTDWATQLQRPREVLEGLVGSPVHHFAYPYGNWAPSGFGHLDAAGYQTAFQLGEKPADPTRPLLTLPRVLVGSSWNGPRLLGKLTA